MKVCVTCGKKFGLFEKVYMSDVDEAFCALCMRANKADSINSDTESVNDGTFVKLNDSVERVDACSNQESTIIKKEPDSWEFRVVKLTVKTPIQRRNLSIEKIEEVINKMGSEGWELVSVLPLNTLLMKTEKVDQPAMVFKRIKKSLGASL